MRNKARSTFRTAQELAVRAPNDAASRLYFALYQAAVSSLTAGGRSPRGLDPNFDPARPDFWHHNWVKNNLRLVGVEGSQDKQVYRQALALRLQADYQPDPVDRSALEPCLRHAQRLLELMDVGA